MAGGRFFQRECLARQNSRRAGLRFPDAAAGPGPRGTGFGARRATACCQPRNSRRRADRSAADCRPGASNDRAAARRVRAAAGWSAPQFLQRAKRPGADLRPARRSTSAGSGAIYAAARANLHSQFEPSANWRRAELRSARRVRAEQYDTVVSRSAPPDQSAASLARLATALWAVAGSKFIAALSVI